MSRHLAVVATALVVLAAAPVAHAADRRVASPTGSGDCIASPCDIATALSGAQPNDEVVITTGDYGSAASPKPALSASAAHLTVHGGPGRPRPRIFTNGNIGLLLTGAQTDARHFEVHQVSTDVNKVGLEFYGDQASDLLVRATGQGGKACTVIGTGSLSNSVCDAPGKDGRGIYQFANFGSATTARFRNVTALALHPGTGNAMLVIGSATDTQDLTVTNALLRSGATELQVSDQMVANAARVTIDHSNFYFSSNPAFPENGPIVDAGGNQRVTAPRFRSVGDYHQAPGSPTINAGVNSALNGLLDVDGDLRTLGGRTNMGADEFVPRPGAITGPARRITPTTAALTGSVNPNSKATAYRFQFGRTAGYGSQSPLASAGAGLALRPVGAQLRGLTPNALYHYRVVARSSAGTTFGADRTFRTPRRPCVVPRLRGLTLKRAKRRLRRARCRLGKVRRPKSRRLRRRKLVVKKQSPRPGARRANGARVKVTLGPKRRPRRR